MPAPEGDLDLDTVWVGLGMASDFIGKDVRGKAVFVYSVATPSSLIQSAAWMGAAERAQQQGAGALIVVLAIPGNLSYVSHLQGARLSNDLKLPIFTVGLDDGEKVESLNALSGAGRLTTRVRWKVETVPGLKAVNVVGVLPGRTDENIVMILSHGRVLRGSGRQRGRDRGVDWDCRVLRQAPQRAASPNDVFHRDA